MRNRLAIRRSFAMAWLHAYSAGRMRGHPYASHASMELPLPCQRRWCNLPEDLSRAEVREWLGF